MTKYRRVSNVFPQVIAKPLEGERVLRTPLAAEPNFMFVVSEDSIFTHPASVDLSANMTDRKSSRKFAYEAFFN